MTVRFVLEACFANLTLRIKLKKRIRISWKRCSIQNSNANLKRKLKCCGRLPFFRSNQLAYSQAREAAEERLADSSGLPEAIRKMRGRRD